MSGTVMPHANHCVVPDTKLTDYLMNLDHEGGRSKAMFFLRFGFNERDLEPLRTALLIHPTTNTVSKKSVTAFGEKYVITCTLQTPDGRNPCIHTVWIDEGSAMPTLVTAYPSKSSQVG